MENPQTDKLLADLQAVIRNAEQLLRATAGEANETIADARLKAEETIREAKRRLQSVQDQIFVSGRALARDADRYAHRHPWNAIGIAAGIAFVVGLIAGRRGD